MKQTRVLVLGIGNLLWADEGFGVRCVERFHERWEVPPGVVLLDGGTQGLYLVNDVADAERVVVLDAIDFGLAPGTMRILEGDEVPRYAIAKKMSMHQTGFQDVLAAVELMGNSPREVVLIGVQPVELEDFGGSLSPAVEAQVDHAVAEAVLQLRRWGYTPRARLSPAAPLIGPGLTQKDYEAGRPSEHDACRTGDPRLVNPPLKRRSG